MTSRRDRANGVPNELVDARIHTSCMSSSLSFVPRKLAKGLNATKPQTSNGTAYRSSQALSSSMSPATPKPSDVTPDPPSKYDDEDCANLVALSLSDYALWIDADLRQNLGVGAQPDPKSSTRCEHYCVYR